MGRISLFIVFLFCQLLVAWELFNERQRQMVFLPLEGNVDITKVPDKNDQNSSSSFLYSEWQGSQKKASFKVLGAVLSADLYNQLVEQENLSVSDFSLFNARERWPYIDLLAQKSDKNLINFLVASTDGQKKQFYIRYQDVRPSLFSMDRLNSLLTVNKNGFDFYLHTVPQFEKVDPSIVMAQLKKGRCECSYDEIVGLSMYVSQILKNKNYENDNIFCSLEKLSKQCGLTVKIEKDRKCIGDQIFRPLGHIEQEGTHKEMFQKQKEHLRELKIEILGLMLQQDMGQVDDETLNRHYLEGISIFKKSKNCDFRCQKILFLDETLAQEQKKFLKISQTAD